MLFVKTMISNKPEELHSGTNLKNTEATGTSNSKPVA